MPSKRVHLQPFDITLAAGAAVSSFVLVAAMRTTSTTSDGDPFDSTLYSWSWVILPAAGGVIAFLRPRGGRVGLWVLALTGPIVLSVALLGTVFHDPGDGASFWLVGEIFVLVQGAVVFLFASLGAATRLRLGSRR